MLIGWQRVLIAVMSIHLVFIVLTVVASVGVVGELIALRLHDAKRAEEWPAPISYAIPSSNVSRVAEGVCRWRDPV